MALINFKAPQHTTPAPVSTVQVAQYRLYCRFDSTQGKTTPHTGTQTPCLVHNRVGTEFERKQNITVQGENRITNNGRCRGKKMDQAQNQANFWVLWQGDRGQLHPGRWPERVWSTNYGRFTQASVCCKWTRQARKAQNQTTPQEAFS